MGFRFRKSINIGGGFRVNLSKSGIGYSFGGKGARFTRTANGKSRYTLSIPGTGISYVTQSGKKKYSVSNNKRVVRNYPTSIQNEGQYKEDSIESKQADKMVSSDYQNFIAEIRKIQFLNSLMNWLISIAMILNISYEFGNSAFILFLITFVIIKIYIRFIKKISIIYEFDKYGKDLANMVDVLIIKVMDNQKLWQINEVYKNENLKTNAGAGHSVTAIPIKITKKVPHFLRTNANCYTVRLKKETLFILPDKIIISDKKKIGAINTKSLDMVTSDINFIEEQPVPSDAIVSGSTWKYVNKNGSPDKRFKDNRQLPICIYGRLLLKSPEGLNILLQCSNVRTLVEFSDLFNQLNDKINTN